MAELIRILHVLGCLDRGGAESMVMNLYRTIDREKVQFDFIVHTKKTCAFDAEVYALGGKIFRIPRYKVSNHVTYTKQWNLFFKNHPEYSIVHGHVRSTAAIYLNIAKKYGLITIAHSHSTSSGSGFPSIAKDILQYPIRFTADYLFACSRAAGKWLFGEKACQKNNFYIFNNAIDAKQFAYDTEMRTRKRKELKLEGKLVVGHVGRFHPSKNHEFLINIFKVIHEKNKNAVLLLVGDGELRNAIQKKVNALGIADSVIFAGVCSDVHELFQAMDVFVFPSSYEGLAIVVIEAQAAGLNSFVSDNVPEDVGISELVHFIAHQKDEQYWAEYVLNHIDYNRRVDMYGDIAGAGYDIQDTAKWIQRFYTSLKHSCT